MASTRGRRGLWVSFASVVSCGTVPWGVAGHGHSGTLGITLDGPAVFADLSSDLVVLDTQSKDHRVTQQRSWLRRNGIEERGFWPDQTGPPEDDKDHREVPGGIIPHVMIRGEEDISPWYCEGLALVRHGQKPRVYRRVGIVRYTFRNRKKKEEFLSTYWTKNITEGTLLGASCAFR